MRCHTGGIYKWQLILLGRTVQDVIMKEDALLVLKKQCFRERLYADMHPDDKTSQFNSQG